MWQRNMGYAEKLVRIVFIPLNLTCGHLTVADFFTVGALAVFELGISRGLLGFCRTAVDGFVAVAVLARAFEVLLDFPAVTVWWCVLEVLASSLERMLANLGELTVEQAGELFFSWLTDLGRGVAGGGLLGAFLITSGKGGDRGRWSRVCDWVFQNRLGYRERRQKKVRLCFSITVRDSTEEYKAYSGIPFTSPAGRVVTSRGSFFKSAWDRIGVVFY